MQSTTHSPHDHSTVVDETSSSAAAATNGDSLSTRCDCCKSCGAILELDGCGHRFHPRCIYSYPITQCELCSTAVTTVKIFRPFKNSTNTMERKGKWSVDEHKYANMMMKQFKNGAMPLVDGLHLRGFIANLLQCDPLRVTKKYAGQAIGKQNFYYQRNKSYCYNVHTKLQKRVSDLRNHFYWHIQYRCKFGYAINIQELKTAEADYWIREFNKFANKIGQRVEFATPSTTVAPASPLSSPSPSLSQSSVASIRPSTTTQSDEASTTVVVVPAVMAPPPSTQTEQQPASRPHVDVAHAEKTYAVDLTMPFKQLIEQAVSPISFDEWRENGTPSLDVFDKVQLEDLTKQYSDQLTEIFNPLADAAGQSDKLTSRCGMREWILDEEKGWNDSLSGTSWSFSIPLSDA